MKSHPAPKTSSLISWLFSRRRLAADPDIPPRRYDIPAGLMGAALEAYRQRSGVHVTLPVPGLHRLISPGVSGFFTAQQAIEQLLRHTGLVCRFTGEKAAAIIAVS